MDPWKRQRLARQSSDRKSYLGSGQSLVKVFIGCVLILVGLAGIYFTTYESMSFNIDRLLYFMSFIFGAGLLNKKSDTVARSRFPLLIDILVFGFFLVICAAMSITFTYLLVISIETDTTVWALIGLILSLFCAFAIWKEIRLSLKN